MNMPISAGLAVLLLTATTVEAAEFKKPEDCSPGTRVVDRQNRAGTVAAFDNGMCMVTLADGSQRSYLVWMLRAAGAGEEVVDRLLPGTYPCYSSGNYLFMDLIIDSASAYRSGKSGGGYRLQADGRIVFGDGPLKTASARLLEGPRVGLNLDGGDFYNVSCSLKKP